MRLRRKKPTWDELSSGERSSRVLAVEASPLLNSIMIGLGRSGIATPEQAASFRQITAEYAARHDHEARR
jgi:hypothetical protein